MSPLRLLPPLLFFLSAVPVAATQVKIFQARSQEAFLAGTLERISVDPLGTLQLADRADRLTAIQEPFLLSAAAHPEGWIVGTGNAGRVLKIDREGRVTTLFATSEPEVFAVWADSDGTVFAGSSPHGKVYRFTDGEVEELFDPRETYIWALARARNGSLLVATGTQGKLFKVDGEGQGEVFYDSDDTHLRTLEVLDDGQVLVGTAGEGLVLLIDQRANARTLYDAAQPEIVAFAAADDGTRYVAALASEASFVDLSRRLREKERRSSDESESENESKDEARVTVVEQMGEAATGSRRPGFRGPRSEVLRITRTGVVESLWKFEDETVYSLLWHRGRLWAGTGLEGKLYSYRGSRMVLEKDVDERQVVGLLSDQPGPAFATTNAAALYRLTGGTEQRGTYTSAVVDAGLMARFGTLHWEGELPRGTEVTFSFRSGVSSEPDRTWSAWTPAKGGSEVSLEKVPRGRYLQWRAELVSSNGRSPRITGVEISYLQENLKPQIKTFAVLDAGQILVPGNFNPSGQVFEPAHPNRQGIFSSLGPPAPPGGDKLRLKSLWKKGYRTLRWSAEDPNADELSYQLFFRPEENPTGWLTVVEELEESHYSFDATVLPDGLYRFRLVASDEPGNANGGALTAEQISESVVIDHTSPALAGVRRQSSLLKITVDDELSPLREAVFSVNAAEWKPAEVEDHLLDGRAETFLLEIPDDATLVLLRVTDAAFNVVTFDLSGHLR